MNSGITLCPEDHTPTEIEQGHGLRGGESRHVEVFNAFRRKPAEVTR
jgi:hypothetical protein